MEKLQSNLRDQAYLIRVDLGCGLDKVEVIREEAVPIGSEILVPMECGSFDPNEEPSVTWVSGRVIGVRNYQYGPVPDDDVPF